MSDVMIPCPSRKKAFRGFLGWVLMLLAFLPIRAGGPSSISVWVNPRSTTLLVGGTQSFTSTVQGTTKTAVTWSCVGGTITSTGLYTAPSTPGTYSVKATLVSNTSKYGTSSVTVVVNQISGVVLNPSTATVGTSQYLEVRANVTGSGDLSGTWSFSDGKASFSGGDPKWIAPFGTHNVSGVSYTTPATPGIYTVTYTCKQDPAKSATATITVIPPGVTVSPDNVNLASGKTQQFTASVVGLGNTAVTWSCTGGTISLTGLYTAPTSMGTYAVTATSVQDPTKFATVNVKVSIKVFFDRLSINLFPNDRRWLKAMVEGTTNTAVTYACSGGTLELGASEVTYTAPAKAGRYTITATSVEDPNQSAVLEVIVNIKVDPIRPSGRMLVGTTYQFSAKVTGTDDTRVIWSYRYPYDQYQEPQGISLTPDGLLTAPTKAPVGQSYFTVQVVAKSVADPNQSAINEIYVYELPSITVTPTAASLPLGGTLELEAGTRGTDIDPGHAFWSATGGTVQSLPGTTDTWRNLKVQYTAPRVPGIYTVKVSPSNPYSPYSTTAPIPGVFTETTLTVLEAPALVTLIPGQVSIETGGTQQYRATVTGVSDPTVIWSCTAGSISADGLYTAPATTGTYTITAASNVDVTKLASITVIVKAATVKRRVTLSPKAVSVNPGGTINITATTTGLTDTSLIWYDPYTGNGTFTSSGNTGTYKAPAVVSRSFCKSAPVGGW